MPNPSNAADHPFEARGIPYGTIFGVAARAAAAVGVITASFFVGGGLPALVLMSLGVPLALDLPGRIRDASNLRGIEVPAGVQKKAESSLRRVLAKAHMRAPHLKVFNTNIVDVRASGNFGREAVLVNRGAVDALRSKELDGAMAHEMGHIRNHTNLKAESLSLVSSALRYATIFTLIGAVTGTLGWLAIPLAYHLGWLAPVTASLSWLEPLRGEIGRLAAPIPLWVGYRRSQVQLAKLLRHGEYQADGASVTIQRNGNDIGQALTAIERVDSAGDPADVESELAKRSHDGLLTAGTDHPHLGERLDHIEKVAAKTGLPFDREASIAAGLRVKHDGDHSALQRYMGRPSNYWISRRTPHTTATAIRGGVGI